MLGQGGTGNEKVGLFILYIVFTGLYISKTIKEEDIQFLKIKHMKK
ncbi:hypothetical protein S2E19_02093 [Bacillus mycoides]|nr:hypothetical protein BTJ44_03938 [Bacillus mycoides]OSY09531.1 hypothetical protein S2E19_02093 [Bacillus mycoides]OSY14359.1 hypothetical protein BTJ48_04793 [Bacillus mycoides]